MYHLYIAHPLIINFNEYENYRIYKETFKTIKINETPLMDLQMNILTQFKQRTIQNLPICVQRRQLIFTFHKFRIMQIAAIINSLVQVSFYGSFHLLSLEI